MLQGVRYTPGDGDEGCGRQGCLSAHSDGQSVVIRVVILNVLTNCMMDAQNAFWKRETPINCPGQRRTLSKQVLF